MAGVGLQKNGDVAYRQFAAGEGGVLLHLETGQYYGVNRLGAAIWNLIDGSRTGEGVVAELRQGVEDPPSTLGADVERFLDGIRRRDLIF
jgi:coenzyme PQQ synthesis protein D (PqqD)